MRNNIKNQAGNIGLIVFVVIGIVVAAAAFFITFITTQKASEPPKYKNLIIPVPSDPPRPSFDALPSSALIFGDPTPIPETSSSPSTEPLEENGPIL